MAEEATPVTPEPRVTPKKKTSPGVRRSTDDFAKDYLVKLEDPTKVPDSVHEANKADLEASALQRGIRLTGKPSIETKKIDDNNVLITYTAKAEPNTVR